MSSIILIEDGSDTGEVQAQTLRAQGHEVKLAQNGEEALTLAAAHRPDMIVAINAAPVVDNVPLLELLNATPTLKDLAMVIMNPNRTTNGQPGATRVYNRFYDDMLTPDQLAMTINEVLAKDASRQVVAPPSPSPIPSPNLSPSPDASAQPAVISDGASFQSSVMMEDGMSYQPTASPDGPNYQ